MKPFDLEAAKRGEPIQTIDDRKIRFVTYDDKTECLVGQISGYNHLTFWKSNELEFLFMAPKKRTVWVNLYKGGNADYFKTKEEADSCIGRIGGKAYPVEIEE